MLSLGSSGGKWRRDSEDLGNMPSVLVYGLAHISPPHEFQASVYRRNALPVAHLCRSMEAAQVEHPPVDDPLFL